MLYKILRPSDDGPPVVIDHINICEVKIDNPLFIYTALVSNKIVPSNWFQYKELLLNQGMSCEWVIRQKAPRRDILYMQPIEQNKIAKQMKLKAKPVKKQMYVGYDAPRIDWGEMRYMHVDNNVNIPQQPQIEIALQDQAPQQIVGIEPDAAYEANVNVDNNIADVNIAVPVVANPINVPAFDDQFINDMLVRLERYAPRRR